MKSIPPIETISVTKNLKMKTIFTFTDADFILQQMQDGDSFSTGLWQFCNCKQLCLELRQVTDSLTLLPHLVGTVVSINTTGSNN